MTTTTFSSREFNQHVSDAKKAALSGPVIITDRGKPAHVLLCIEDYCQITYPDPKSERDALIAATAQAHNMTVVTRNVKDFSDVDIINPWAV